MVSGKDLRLARQRLRLSQDELGLRLRASRRTIARWESEMELPEGAIPVVEAFLAEAAQTPREPTLSEATDIQLATELLQRLSRRNTSRPPIDGRIGINVPDPDAVNDEHS